MRAPNTPGGNRLRTLREYRGRTQLDVELEAHLGIGYLQRLEAGKVQQPERETLERILAALGARYTERRDILELFGYVVDAPLPTEDDIQWAIAVCQAEIDSAVFPVYLLDCAHRLLSWNLFIPMLFKMEGLQNRPAIAPRVSMLRVVSILPTRWHPDNQPGCLFPLRFVPCVMKCSGFMMSPGPERSWMRCCNARFLSAIGGKPKVDRSITWLGVRWCCSNSTCLKRVCYNSG
jgi:transcriptional regulator with XRE-family HTH domain